MEKRKIGLGITSIILGATGLVTSCMCIGIVPGTVGVILSVVGLNKENQKNNVCTVGLITSSVSVLISLIISIVFLATPTDTSESSYSTTENSTEIQVEKTTETTEDLTEQTTEVSTEKETEEVTTTSTTEEMKTEETTEEILVETEEEYKSKCQEMYYDDVFFNDNLSKGDYVKLYLMVSENYYFTADALYSDSFQTLMKNWDLHRDFKKCSVLREEEAIYAGVGKIDLYFSNKYDCNPNDYDLGDKIIIYGEVISFYKDDWDGYNDVIIIPKYIEYQ